MAQRSLQHFDVIQWVCCHAALMIGLVPEVLNRSMFKVTGAEFFCIDQLPFQTPAC